MRVTEYVLKAYRQNTRVPRFTAFLVGAQFGKIFLKSNRCQEPLKGHTIWSSNSASQNRKEENKQKMRRRMYVDVYLSVVYCGTRGEFSWGLQYTRPLEVVFSKGT